MLHPLKRKCGIYLGSVYCTQSITLKIFIIFAWSQFNRTATMCPLWCSIFGCSLVRDMLFSSIAVEWLSSEHVIHLTWMLTFVTYSIVLVREKPNPIYITEATTGVEKHFCFVLLCFSLFITQQNSFRFFLLKKRNTFFLRISFRGSSWLFFVPVFNELMNAWTRQLSFYSQITTAILWAFYVFGVVVVAVVFNILNQHDASHPYALFIDNVWSFIAYTYTHDYVPFFLLKFSFLSAFSSDFDCFMVSIRWRS